MARATPFSFLTLLWSSLISSSTSPCNHLYFDSHARKKSHRIQGSSSSLLDNGCMYYSNVGERRKLKVIENREINWRVVCWNPKKIRSIISCKLIAFLIKNCMIKAQRENILVNPKNIQKILKCFRKPLSAQLS